MSEPTISNAKALAAALRKRGIIILAFTSNKVSAASYGFTAKDCRALGKVVDQIVDSITSGEIQVPFDLDEVEVAE